MRGSFQSNLLTIGLMGVLLLLASAVGRVTANTVSQRLFAPSARADRMNVEALGAMDVALAEWRKR